MRRAPYISSLLSILTLSQPWPAVNANSAPWVQMMFVGPLPKVHIPKQGVQLLFMGKIRPIQETSHFCPETE
jgi:hypothetical protein